MTNNSQSHQFKLLLENKFAGVILWNKNKILTHMNDNVKEFGISGKRFKIGYCWYDNFEEILLLKKIEFLMEQNNVKHDQELLNLLERGKKINCEDRQSVKNWAKEFGDIRLKNSGVSQETQHPDGSWSNVIDLVFEDGSFITIANDITNFKTNESESRKFRQAIDEIPYVIDLWDKEDNLIFSNRYSRDLWAKFGIEIKIGLSFEKLIQEFIKIDPNLNIKELKESRKNLIDQHISEAYLPEPVDKTNLIIDKRLSNGGILSIHTDITELKKTQKIQQRLLEAVNELPMIIELWDEKDNVVFSNKFSKEFNKTRGFELKEGKSALELVTSQAKNLSTKKAWFESRKKDIFKDIDHFDLLDNQIFIERILQWRESITDQLEEEANIGDQTFLASLKRLSDGGLFTRLTDITTVKDSQKIQEQLYEAINELPMIVDLWDNDDRLVMSNNYSKECNLKAGIKIYQGMHISDLARQSGVDEKQIEYFLDKRKRLKNEETFEFNPPYDEKRTNLVIDKKLPSGGILSVHSDISDLKEVQKVQNSLFEAINELPILIDLWDENDALIFMNQASKKINDDRGIKT